MPEFNTKVTQAEAEAIIKSFAVNTRDRTQAADCRRGIVPGSTSHYLFTAEATGLIRHGVIAKLQAPYKGGAPHDWLVAYMSIVESEAEAAQRLNLLGRESNFLGPAGVTQALPRKLRSIEADILPLDRLYIGFDFMGVEPQPDFAEIESALSDMSQLLEAV